MLLGNRETEIIRSNLLTYKEHYHDVGCVRSTLPSPYASHEL